MQRWFATSLYTEAVFGRCRIFCNSVLAGLYSDVMTSNMITSKYEALRQHLTRSPRMLMAGSGAYLRLTRVAGTLELVKSDEPRRHLSHVPFQGGAGRSRHGCRSCGWAVVSPTDQTSPILPGVSQCLHFRESGPAATPLHTGRLSVALGLRSHCLLVLPPSRPRSSPTLIGPRITARSHPQLSTKHTQKQAYNMCLVKVKQEEDVVVPYRVVQRNHSPPRRRASHTSARRYSRTEVVRESPRPSASYIAVPAPKPLQIPAPQPVPVFFEPPPAPMPAPPPPPSHISSHHTHQTQQTHHGAHYVEVSPRSSVSSQSSSPPRSEYVYREREVRRERQYSPDRAPRYEHFRYVEPAPSESDHYERSHRRERSRQRSVSRGGYEDPRGSYRETNTRVTMVDDNGQRRREYRR